MKSLRNQVRAKGVSSDLLDAKATKEVLPDSIFDSTPDGGGAWFGKAFLRIPLP